MISGEDPCQGLFVAVLFGFTIMMTSNYIMAVFEKIAEAAVSENNRLAL